MGDLDALLEEQLAYYRRRAVGYDDWFFRRGRFDHGPELNERWFAEVDQVAAALEYFNPHGDVLELASGTGIWTQRLVRYADRLLAVDGSTEMLELNRHRLGETHVEYVHANLFEWQPTEQFDLVFFSFWLTHVPPARFDSFWALVDSALKASGRVFFIDSRYDPTSTAVGQTLTKPGEITVRRRLDDGSEWDVIKIFYGQDELTERLREIGWGLNVEATPHYFIYGAGTRGATK